MGSQEKVAQAGPTRDHYAAAVVFDPAAAERNIQLIRPSMAILNASAKSKFRNENVCRFPKINLRNPTQTERVNNVGRGQHW